jgi:hypothetical protein
MPEGGEEIHGMTMDEGALGGPETRTSLDSLADADADPLVVEPATELLSAGEASTVPAKAHTPWPLGYIAFGIAVLLVLAEGVAVYLASSGQPAAATIIGQVLVVLTALPLALGLVAVLRGRNREWGLAAMVLAVVANPFILINVLGFFGAI